VKEVQMLADMFRVVTWLWNGWNKEKTIRIAKRQSIWLTC